MIIGEEIGEERMATKQKIKTRNIWEKRPNIKLVTLDFVVCHLSFVTSMIVAVLLQEIFSVFLNWRTTEQNRTEQARHNLDKNKDTKLWSAGNETKWEVEKSMRVHTLTDTLSLIKSRTKSKWRTEIVLKMEKANQHD